MIINLDATVTTILNSVVGIELVATDYPATWAAFPIAIYRTSHSPVYIDAYQREQLTEWTVTVELYSDRGSLNLLTEELREAMGSHGFFGTTTHSNVAGLRRVVCTFTAVIDNDNQRVYHTK